MLNMSSKTIVHFINGERELREECR